MRTFRWWYRHKGVAQQRALPRCPGHLVWTLLIWLSFLSTVAPQALAQERSDAPTGTIQGKALLAQDSTTVMPGTNVSLIKNDTTFTWVTADIKGQFTIDDVPSGTQTLRILFAGLTPVEMGVEVAAGETTVVTVYVGIVVTEDDLMFSPSDAEKDLAKGRVNLLTLDMSDFLVGATGPSRRYFWDSDQSVSVQRECWEVFDRIRPKVERGMLGMERRTVVYDGDQPPEVWIRSIRAYNDVVKAYLEETYGADWEERVRERTWERVMEEMPVCPW